MPSHMWGRLDIWYWLRFFYSYITFNYIYLQISNNNIQGNSPQIKTYTNQDGGVLFFPIQGDMLRAAYDQPQVFSKTKMLIFYFQTIIFFLISKVSVVINGIPSICSGDCTFAWDESITPVVTSITKGWKNSILFNHLISFDFIFSFFIFNLKMAKQ